MLRANKMTSARTPTRASIEAHHSAKRQRRRELTTDMTTPQRGAWVTTRQTVDRVAAVGNERGKPTTQHYVLRLELEAVVKVRTVERHQTQP